MDDVLDKLLKTTNLGRNGLKCVEQNTMAGCQDEDSIHIAAFLKGSAGEWVQG